MIRTSTSSAVAARPMAASHCARSEEHTSELQSRGHLVCRLLLEKKKRTTTVVSSKEDRKIAELGRIRRSLTLLAAAPIPAIPRASGAWVFNGAQSATHT